MTQLRAFAVLFALVIVAGEAFRSWGERSVIEWSDDFMVGVGLVVSSVLLGVETARRRALFTGAWGFAVGITFISFFDKVILAQTVGPGAEFNRINAFVTFTLIVSVAGFAASLALPFKPSI